MAAVSGDNSVGGLVGTNRNESDISDSYAITNVSGKEEVGGLVGLNIRSRITNCNAIADVMGTSEIGGLMGCSIDSIITHCYAAAHIDANEFVGGLVGHDYVPSYFEASFWDRDINPGLDGIGNSINPNVISETTEHMQLQSTFYNAGWDFNDVWAICEYTNYPRLQWMISEADIICPDGVDFTDYAFLAACWNDTAFDCNNTDFHYDGITNFKDYAYLAYYWPWYGCGYCDGVDLFIDGNIDDYDISEFVDCWLIFNCRKADLDDSNSVDANDLDIFTNYWLFGK
jgi:hypothetical protein